MTGGLDHRYRYVGIGLIVAIATGFLAAVLNYTHGSLSLPLDDSFIYFTFARNIAGGWFMHWTPGGGFSSAATNPLYPFLLAIGYGIGFKGEMLVLWAFLVGVACSVASFFLVIEVLQDVLADDYEEWMGLLGGGLFALSGMLMWGYLSGMEIPLFCTVMLITMHHARGFMDDDEETRRRSRTPLAVWGSLLSIMRPEGLILVVLLVALLVLRPLLARDGRTGIRKLGWLAMATPALSWMAITAAFTGHPASAAMRQKSYLFEPVMTPWMLIDLTTQNIAKISTGLYSGFYLSDGSPLFLTPLFFVGLVPAVVREMRARRPALACLSGIWFLIGSLSTMMSLSSDDHHFRYQFPFYVIYLVWSVAGIATLVRLVRDRFPQAAWVVSAWFLVISVISLPRWMNTYGMNSKNIHDQQIRMAKVIERVVPEDDVVGINDAGAIPYFSNRRTFDVLGLATEGQSRWFRAGPGSLYERFERLPADARPDWFAIYPEWFHYEEIFDPVATIRLKDNTICGADEKVLYRSDWSVLGRGDEPWQSKVAGKRLVAEVDVADLDDEASHDYHGPPTTVYGAYPYPEPGQAPPTSQEEFENLRWGPVVADGGRRTGWLETEQEMNVTLEGYGDVVVVGRVECRDMPGRLLLTVDGEQIGEWRISPQPGFVEPQSLLPASTLEQGTNRIGLVYEGEGSVVVYHLWFYR